VEHRTVPTRRPVSLLALRAFEAAARRLSFTEAARELHVSQAAVSRHVRALEHDLDGDLFRRLHRRVELTPRGQRLAAELTAGFLQIHRAVESARSGSTQALRLTCEPAFAARWLVPRLESFSTLHPDIDIDLDSSYELRVLGRDADLAIRHIAHPKTPPRGKARRLFAVEGVPVVARARSPGPGARDDRDVLRYRLLHEDDGSAWRAWFASAGLDPPAQVKQLHLGDEGLALTAALRGLGVALGVLPFIGPDLRGRRLMQLGRTRSPFGEYWVLEAPGRATGAARRAFVAWLELELQLPKRA
jgi:LysR family glycine cleavage system transcriptional activator